MNHHHSESYVEILPTLTPAQQAILDRAASDYAKAPVTVKPMAEYRHTPEVQALDAEDAGYIARRARQEFARLALLPDYPSIHAMAEAPPAPRYPAVIGIDLSMTNTGYAANWGDGDIRLHRIQSKPIQNGTDAKGKPTATWEDRRVRMAAIVENVVDYTPGGALVFLEAPSYGSTGSGTFDRSGLWWMLYAELATHYGCRVVPVSPSQRMLYATGKGGGKDAGKDAVIAAVVRRYPDLTVTDNNVADAVVLMAMARRWAGDPMEDSLPAANLKAMDKLEAL